MASHPVGTSHGKIKVTVSAGLILSREWGARTAEELLYEVDVALYAAKAAGRNCVRLAKPEGPQEAVPATAPASCTPHS
jgi:GGDEF domain-containing protein